MLAPEPALCQFYRHTFLSYKGCQSHSGYYVLDRPAAVNRPSGLYVLLLFLIYNDSCQTNYLNIYRTDLRQILRVGRTTVAADPSEINLLLIPQGTLHDNQFLLVLSTKPNSGNIRPTSLAYSIHGCRRRLVAQPGGLTPGFASHLVFHCVQTSLSCRRHRRTACCTTTRRSASYVSCERDTARMHSLRPALKRRCRWARGASVDPPGPQQQTRRCGVWRPNVGTSGPTVSPLLLLRMLRGHLHWVSDKTPLPTSVKF